MHLQRKVFVSSLVPIVDAKVLHHLRIYTMTCNNLISRKSESG